MVKYLTAIIDRLKKMKTGIHNNTGDWTGQPVQETDVNTEILALEAKQQAIKQPYHSKRNQFEQVLRIWKVLPVNVKRYLLLNECDIKISAVRAGRAC